MGACEINVDLKLAFPKAGLVFAITVQSPEGAPEDEATTFHLTVKEASGERQVPFTPDQSPQVADWARGYTRWLRRAGVTASHNEDSITGSFAAGLTPEQVLLGLRDACDMIRQRFGLYEEGVLA